MTSASPRKISPTRSGTRFSGGWLSGSRTTETTASSRASAAMNQKTVCHGPTWISSPPTIGAIAGATPKITATWLIIRWAFGPSKRSRMTVRLTIVEPPAASPWATRPTSSHSSDGANAQATDATA